MIEWISGLMTPYAYYEDKVILERVGGKIHAGDAYAYEEPWCLNPDRWDHFRWTCCFHPAETRQLETAGGCYDEVRERISQG